jgi:hypothetical protein
VRRNWLVLLLVCVAVVMMVVLPGCRSKKPSEDGDKVSMLISNAKTYSWKLADLAWQKVKDPMNANLSAMENLDEIETDPTAKTPDFSKVSGGGIYIVDGQAEGNMCIGSIKWSGAGDKVDEGFAFPSDAEASSYEMIQNGQINRVFSPHSGYAWTAYCPDWADAGATLAQIDKYYDGRIKLYGSTDSYKGENADPESTFVEKGAYVYTMFAKEPEEGQSLTIEKELDMTDGSVTIEFTTDGEVAYPAIIKLMIRDGNGDWYLGGAPDEEELPPEEDPEPVEGEEVAEIDETFGWTGWGALVGWNQSSAIRKSDATGFAWTGYSPTGGEVNPINSDEHWDSRIKFEKGIGNIPGNYVFTIFDITGGNEANRWVNMSAGTLVVSLDKEGEDPYPAQFKVLARDGDGSWFLSDAVEVNTGSNSIAFADLTWNEVDSAVAGWMNQLKAGDSSAYGMQTGEDAATPDLTKVTGGGIYIDSITNADAGSVNLTALKWSAGGDE